jgi:hypothetical protein
MIISLSFLCLIARFLILAILTFMRFVSWPHPILLVERPQPSQGTEGSHQDPTPWQVQVFAALHISELRLILRLAMDLLLTHVTAPVNIIHFRQANILGDYGETGVGIFHIPSFFLNQMVCFLIMKYVQRRTHPVLHLTAFIWNMLWILLNHVSV